MKINHIYFLKDASRKFCFMVMLGIFEMYLQFARNCKGGPQSK